MSLERLAFLRDLIIDHLVVREPARPQNGVVLIGLLDEGRRLPIAMRRSIVRAIDHVDL
jgi:hypothetical protein